VIFLANVSHRAEKGEALRLGMLIPAVFIGLQLLVVLAVFLSTRGLLQLPLFQGLTIPLAATAAVVPTPAGGNGGVSWVDQVIPPNLFAAAGSDALIPLILFALVFGLAAKRLTPELEHVLKRAAQAIQDALFVIFDWLLWLAPIPLFALAFRSAARSGLELGQIMVAFVAIATLMTLVAVATLYVAAVLGGRIPFGRFAKAAFPAQVTAVATRSSLATLPALLRESELTLKLPPTVSALVLPIAASVLKPSRVVNNLVKLLLLTQVLGIHLGFQQIVVFIALALALSATNPGLPAVLAGPRMVPAFLMVGVPPEYVVLLGATISVLDIGLTILNSTSYLTANVLVARLLGARTVPASEGVSPPAWTTQPVP
jgi:Na+/H+-dicarboxylate symporter